jgi:hypothetical protein
MLFMVVEKITPKNLESVRSRFLDKGRMLPAGVEYRASWLSLDGTLCFQLMASPSRDLLDEWATKWNDLVEFEIREVLTSEDFWRRFEAAADQES